MVEVVSAGRLSNLPDHKMTREQPANHLVMWVVEGQGFARSGNLEVLARPGTVMVLPAGRCHAYASDTQRPWDQLWVHCQGPAVDHWVDRFGHDFGISAELGVRPGLIDPFTEVIAAHHGGGPALRLAHHLCWALLGRIEHRLAMGALSPRNQHADALTRVQNYIEARLDQPISVHELAEVANLSTRHLNRLCRSAWHLAPMSYVIRQRLARASLLLTESTLPIGEIALATGFSDPYHFSRMFRRHVGRTPSAVRHGVTYPPQPGPVLDSTT